MIMIKKTDLVYAGTRIAVGWIEKDCKACTVLSKSEYIAMNSLASLLLVIVDSILGYRFRKYSAIATGEWQLGYIGKLKELEE